MAVDKSLMSGSMTMLLLRLLAEKDMYGYEMIDTLPVSYTHLLLTREEAQKILKDGVDDQGLFYPLYTWAALMCFVTGMWE